MRTPPPVDAPEAANSPALTGFQSAVLRAMANDSGLYTAALIAEIENTHEAAVLAACRRAMSLIRHPAATAAMFTDAELAAADRLAGRLARVAAQPGCRDDPALRASSSRCAERPEHDTALGIG